MRIYRFTLPQIDNSGMTMAGPFITLRRFILDRAGGYTQQPDAAGVWINEGQEYRDQSWVVDIALDDKITYAAILGKVRDLWPDQHSFFVADVGEAHFIPGFAAEESPLGGAGAEWQSSINVAA